MNLLDSDHPFSLSNVPFGIISTEDDVNPRPAVRINDWALDISVVQREGHFDDIKDLSRTAFQTVGKTSVLSNLKLN